MNRKRPVAGRGSERERPGDSTVVECGISQLCGSIPGPIRGPSPTTAPGSSRGRASRQRIRRRGGATEHPGSAGRGSRAGPASPRRAAAAVAAPRRLASPRLASHGLACPLFAAKGRRCLPARPRFVSGKGAGSPCRPPAGRDAVLAEPPPLPEEAAGAVAGHHGHRAPGRGGRAPCALRLSREGDAPAPGGNILETARSGARRASGTAFHRLRGGGRPAVASRQVSVCFLTALSPPRVTSFCCLPPPAFAGGAAAGCRGWGWGWGFIPGAPRRPPGSCGEHRGDVKHRALLFPCARLQPDLRSLPSRFPPVAPAREGSWWLRLCVSLSDPLG